MCDFITLNLLKKREVYREKKYEDANVDDEFVSESFSNRGCSMPGPILVPSMCGATEKEIVV